MSTSTPLLAEETMAIVESTAPILREHGRAITGHFYENLLRTHPEVAPMFSDPHGLQADRLAAAVLAYATNIRNLEALAPAVQRIAAAHVGAGVQPAQYDVVGNQLLASMVSVLGEIDVAVLDAWAAAYGVLADILIAEEATRYAAE